MSTVIRKSKVSQPSVSVDLKELIPLSEVPKLLPSLRRGKPVNLATVYRWTNEGSNGVRLAYLNIGSTRCTTHQWIKDFISHINQGITIATTSQQPEARKIQDDDETDRRLDSMFSQSDSNRVKKPTSRKLAARSV
jgi:hypothetical protein